MTSKAIAEFDELKSEIQALIAPTRSIQVTSFETANDATIALKQVKAVLLRIEKRRDELVRPMNLRVREVNSYAKGIEGPLLQVERTLKAQLIAFETEQEEKRRAEQRRIENERAQAESLLRIRQEQERQAIVSPQAADDWFGAGEDTEKQRLALEEKHAQEQARLRAEAQAKVWDSEQKGVKNARKVWKCEVVNMDLVPKELQIRTLNEKAVLAMARSGVTTIPGVKLWQETQIAVGANLYIPEVALTEEKD